MPTIIAEGVECKASCYTKVTHFRVTFFMPKPPQNLRTWVEIDKSAIEKNYRFFRKTLGKHVAFCGVIKSNAYGHNIYLYAKELERLGIDMLAVDSIVEGVSLREAGITTPLLVLGYTLPVFMKKASALGIAISVSSTDSLKALSAYRGRDTLSIHIKVDTGMHRQGFQISELPKVMRALRSLPKHIRVEGLFTHFAEAKRPADSARTKKQIVQFDSWIKAFTDAGFHPLVHAGATGGGLVYTDARYDMVRIGIGIYGVWPSEEVRLFRQGDKLSPVLSWRAIVSEVKSVQKGEGVGYDFTEELKRDSRIAIIPIGYWHGYPRLLSGKGNVLIRGKRAKVLGRVSMDMLIVDVTGIKGARAGDIATLIGRDGKESVTAEEIAHHAGTNAYEILTRLNPLMERVLR